MTDYMYDFSVRSMRRMLKNFDKIVSKAEAYAKANDIDEATLLQARLYPNMRTFTFQVQVATDMAKGCAARLTGSEMPTWPDDEVTFADIHARITRTVDYLGTFSAEQFEGSEARDIELKLRDRTLNFDGATYLSGFVLPNFYFHLTTAYNLLRHNGLDIGKGDYLGG
jgi:hypothetical protein